MKIKINYPPPPPKPPPTFTVDLSEEEAYSILYNLDKILFDPSRHSSFAQPEIRDLHAEQLRDLLRTALNR